MAQYNFEGDIENITERQLEFINKVIEEQGFKEYNVTFEPVGIAGDNYVASVKRITIKGENGQLSIIAKIAPSNEVVRMNMNSSLMFKNEHLMYTEVLPKFLQLQKAAEVPEQEHLRFAKCYGSLAEEPNEVILLEDLKTLDFVMLDRFEPLSNECITSVLKNFAIFHSLSYVLKRKEPETYSYYKDNLLDMWGAISSMPEAMVYFQMVEDNSLQLLDDTEHKNMLRHKIAGVPTRAGKMTKLEDGNKYAVIQQGDSWTNNIMFRFEGGELKQSIMIDYQISKNISPVSDLLYMIFNCTDHETRIKHFYDWIDYYHTELDKSLYNFDLKAAFVYPKDQLDADMKRYGKLMFGLSVILANVLTMQPEEASRMKDAITNINVSEMTQSVNPSELANETKMRVKTRLVELIKSFTELGLL